MVSLKKVLIGLGLPVAAIALLPTQSSANVISGNVIIERTCRLDATDGTLQDNSRFDLHQFEGTAGQLVTISLESTDFDPYLIVEGPDGERIGEHDDIDYDNGDLNALINLSLDLDGTYTIYTNSYDSSGFGEYDLAVTSPSNNVETLSNAGTDCQ